MNSREKTKKIVRRIRRQRSVRKKVFGTPERPRLSVNRSLKNISAQIIDDLNGRTLCSASTASKALRDQVKNGGNCEAARIVGQALAETARMQGVLEVRFDRGGYRYHGRVKALADAARKTGLKF